MAENQPMGIGRERWNKAGVLYQYLMLFKEWNAPPTKIMLIRKGYKKLAQYAIPKYFKNFVNIQKEAGIRSSRKLPGHWTEQNTLKELKVFYHHNKLLIENTSVCAALRIKQENGLVNAVARYGGLRAINRKYKLGLILKSKKWNKAEVTRELKELYEAGHTITRENLYKLGRNDLAGALYKFSTLNELKKSIGAPVRKYKIWTERKVIKEIKPILANLGVMPTHAMLKAMGRYDLARAMSKNGGSTKFARLLNAPQRTLLPANDGHYLQSSYECIFDNILFKYNIPHGVHVKISDEYRYKCDFLIGNTYIEIAGYYRKGCDAYSIKMEKKIQLYKRLKKKYIILQKEIFCQRIELVERDVLALLDKNRFRLNASKNHEDCCIKPSTYWANFKNVNKALLPIIKKYDRMPTHKELYKNNLSGLAHAIYKYHGSLFNVAQQLKLKSRQISRNYYSKEKTIADYKTICLLNNKYLTGEELYALNFRALAQAIIKYGGYEAIRQECDLGYLLYRVRIPMCTHEEIIEEYKSICEKHGRFLTRKNLVDHGFSRLAGYLNRHGLGINAARQKTGLNFDTPYLSRGHYTLSQAVDAYKEQCQECGYFLTRRETLTILPPKLVGFIDRNISFTELRKLTRLNY